MQLTSEQVKSQQLGHLGLIAATIQELGIIDRLDKRLSLNKAKGGLVSYGQRVAAMILNGLGFMNSRLYMTPHYFQDKPVSQLLGADIEAAQLNDDCLGRCLDKIAAYGVTKLYSEIAFEIAKEKGLLSQRLHLDSTSFVLYGQYEGQEDASPLPTYGYSKANRADLKQVMLSLVQGGAANLPLWMEALDGNTSDKTSFQATVRKVKTFMQALDDVPQGLCFVVDAEFYVPERLKELEGIYWITRVPATVKEAKQLLQTKDKQLSWQVIDEHYRMSTQQIQVGGIEQRWVLVFSQKAYERELATLYRRMAKASDTCYKALWHLSCQLFTCQADAIQAINKHLKKCPYHEVMYEIVPVKKHPGRGKPKAGSEPVCVGYRIDYTLATDLSKVEQHKQRLGRFILATNQLDSQQLNDANVLRQYKEQAKVEAGFKFIKDNAFELDSLFLKTPERIGALMMVMTLCLMVYNFAQYHLRQCLKDHNDVLPNQLGKPVQNPTLKWIAELMNVIAVVTLQLEDSKQRIVTNVNQVHRKIIAYFGQSALRIYGLPPDYQQVAIHYANYKNLLQWCEM